MTLAEKIIQDDGAAFWQSLIRELKIAAEGLSLIGLHGSVSPAQGKDKDGHQVDGHQVSVARWIDFPRHTTTYLFYTPGAASIGCYTPMDHFHLSFAVEDGKIVASITGGEPLSAAAAARFIVERMVNDICSY